MFREIADSVDSKLQPVGRIKIGCVHANSSVLRSLDENHKHLENVVPGNHICLQCQLAKSQSHLLAVHMLLIEF